MRLPASGIVPVRVAIKSLCLEKPFIYMTDKSLQYNIQALLVSMGLLQNPSEYTYVVDGADLSESRDILSWIKPQMKLTLEKI